MDASGAITMPLDSTAESRSGLETISKLCALSVLRGDKSFDFQTVPIDASVQESIGSVLLYDSLP